MKFAADVQGSNIMMPSLLAEDGSQNITYYTGQGVMLKKFCTESHKKNAEKTEFNKKTPKISEISRPKTQ